MTADAELSATVNKRVAIVTGGSRGIGAAICRQLAHLGMSVHFAYQHADEMAKQVVIDIESAGGKAFAYKVDVSSQTQVESFVAQVFELENALHILVNNAAIVDDQLLASTPLARWERVLCVNLNGPFLMCRAVLPIMLDQAWGRIINISSNSVRIPGAGQTAYAASKGGLEALTRALAAEVGRKGIRVNTVAPGTVKTDMTEAFSSKLGTDGMGARWGIPEDISGIVGFLASDEADYIQGQTITVDGGRLVMRPRSTRA